MRARCENLVRTVRQRYLSVTFKDVAQFAIFANSAFLGLAMAAVPKATSSNSLESFGFHDGSPKSIRPVSLPDIKPRSRKRLESRTKLSNSSKDISHLTDRSKSAQRVPTTLIPEKYHMIEKSISPPFGGEDEGLAYNETERMWETKIFPSSKPTGRREVVLLDNWLNQQLQENVEKNPDPLESVKEAQNLYSVCFHEIIRQVWVNCAERGQLMEKIWNRYLQLFEHILKMREHEREQYNKKIQEHQNMYQQLYRDKDERFNKYYLQLAAEKEKVGMTKDKYERAILVLQEEHKRRVWRERKLKTYIKKMRHQTQKGDDVIKNDEIDEFMVDSDEEDPLDPTDALFANLETDNFSAGNMIIINKLEFIDARLKDISRAFSKSSDAKLGGDGVMSQLESVITTITDTVRRMGTEPLNTTTDTTPSTALGTGRGDPSDLPLNKETTDKGIQTADLEVKLIIPGPFYHLFAKPLKPLIPKVPPKEWIYRCIDLIYCEKMLADEESIAAGKPCTPMAEFVYELFISLYGLRKSAEAHLTDLVATVSSNIDLNLRIKMFAQFCGFSEGVYTIEELNLYLYALHLCYGEFMGDVREEDEAHRQISFDTAVAIINKIFTEEEWMQQVIKRIEPLRKADSVDQDEFLEIITLEARAKTQVMEQQLLKMLASNWEDSASLVYDEFVAILKKISPHRNFTDRQRISMYRELVQCNSQYTMTKGHLLTWFHQHQLLSWKSLPSFHLPPTYRNAICFNFLSSSWEIREHHINEMTKNLQGGLLAPKTYQNLQDYSAEFQKHLTRRDSPDEAMHAYRLFMEQLYCAKQKQNRLVTIHT
ncbi:hypothetical protein PROFUN_10819 [Planoprotostelium fungivorum]|uniref:Uncharacterized protein n=1 Tax=Planoprotostelium fungivorum TaxID=1890364 RepID=A0A2P6NCN8_9EUKA|nr:hypothetical protein PROFUN_10819 [Planoprotostelium fungivorum]